MRFVYYIYFFGLIAHVGGDERKDYAALVSAPDHYAAAWFAADPATDEYALETTRVIAAEFDPPHTTDQAIEDTFFSAYVPSLRVLMGGTVQQNVKDRAIIFNYPATLDDDGDFTRPTISAGSVYEQRATHHSGGYVKRAGCAARLTVIEIRSTSPTMQLVQILADGSRHDLGPPLSGGGCVILANAPKELLQIIGSPLPNFIGPAADDRYPLHHVGYYGEILNGENDAVSARDRGERDCKVFQDIAKAGIHCDWVADRLRLHDEAFKRHYLAAHFRHRRPKSIQDVECGNTDYP